MIIGRIVLALTSLVVCLTLLEIIMRCLPVHDSLQRLPVNSDNPIPRFERNRTIVASLGWNFSLVAETRSNNEGFFSDIDYLQTLSSPLMAVIVDSFVEAQHVPTPLTFHGLLAKDVEGQGRIYTFAAGRQSSPSLPRLHGVYTRDLQSGCHDFRDCTKRL